LRHGGFTLFQRSVVDLILWCFILFFKTGFFISKILCFRGCRKRRKFNCTCYLTCGVQVSRELNTPRAPYNRIFEESLRFPLS